MVTRGKAEEGGPAAVGQEGKPALARPRGTESLSTPFPSSGPGPYPPGPQLPCFLPHPPQGVRRPSPRGE